MPARHRANPQARSTSYRTYRIPEELRTAVRQRREEWGLTVQSFIAQAVDHELDYIVAHLQRAGVQAMKDDVRPARLPLTDDVLASLKEAAVTTGLPASHLLMACLRRGAKRNRRWPQSS